MLESFWGELKKYITETKPSHQLIHTCMNIELWENVWQPRILIRFRKRFVCYQSQDNRLRLAILNLMSWEIAAFVSLFDNAVKVSLSSYGNTSITDITFSIVS